MGMLLQRHRDAREKQATTMANLELQTELAVKAEAERAEAAKLAREAEEPAVSVVEEKAVEEVKLEDAEPAEESGDEEEKSSEDDDEDKPMLVRRGPKKKNK